LPLSLFAAVAPHEPCFEAALRTFDAGSAFNPANKLAEMSAGAWH
jgi:hypothetical protein